MIHLHFYNTKQEQDRKISDHQVIIGDSQGTRFQQYTRHREKLRLNDYETVLKIIPSKDVKEKQANKKHFIM